MWALGTALLQEDREEMKQRGCESQQGNGGNEETHLRRVWGQLLTAAESMRKEEEEDEESPWAVGASQKLNKATWLLVPDHMELIATT